MTFARYFAFLAVMILLVAGTSSAQTVGTTAIGTPPFGSFGGGPDVINLSNLNAHLTIPILHKAGRGKPFAYDLTYDSSIWYSTYVNGGQMWQPVATTTSPGWQGLIPENGGYITYTMTYSAGNCGPGKPIQEWSYGGFNYVDQYGIKHPFQISWNYYSQNNCGAPVGFVPSYPLYQHQVASDGSGYTMDVAEVGSGQAPGIGVTDVNGTILNVPVNPQAGSPTSTTLEDSNGNEITSNNGSFTDALGTNVLNVSGTAPNNTVFSYTAPSNPPASYTVKYAQRTMQTNFGCSGISEYGPASQSLVSEIDLPDGTKYLFAYEPTPGHSSNTTGRLASVALPTGGTINYTYTGANNGITCSDGSAAGLTRQTPDGTWLYSRGASSNGGCTATTITDPLSNQTVINFQRSAYSCTLPLNLYETQRQVYQGSATSGTLLKTTLTCYNGSTTNPCNTTAITLPISQVTVISKWPLGTVGMQSQTTTYYNNYGLPTEKDEYSYGNGAPGAVVRKTLIAYASLNYVMNKPGTITIEDGSLTPVVASRTVYNYDQGTPTPTSGTPQHVAPNGSISRGNLTSVGRWVSNSSSGLSTSYTYFDTGNVQTATDVNGALTTFSYPDATSTCGNSFATKSTVTGTGLPSGGLSKSMTWNCTGGVQTSATDENGNTSYLAYTNAYFWRPDSTTDQAGYVTNITYNGQTSTESSLVFNGGNSTTDVLTPFDGLGRSHFTLVGEQPSPSTYDSVETDYDSLGRPSRTTLPYAGSSGQTCPSCPAITKSYDALSRTTQVTDSESTPQTLTYSYNQNDAYQTLGPAPTGESTKRRQYEYDALGNLISVCELTTLPGSGNCAQTNPATGYWTKYTYDTLSDLTGVTQNAQSTGQQQSRSYYYDGLKRMTGESNPESGWTSYVYDTDAACGTSYGDLVRKVDHVGNTICYAYDALHRVTSVTYPTSDPYASVTPNKYFVYDSATVNGVAMANAKTHMAEAYTATCITCTKITDEGFSYTVRGEPSDAYESTPNSGSYYHVAVTYFANGALKQIGSLVGLPTFTYNVDGEGRVYSISASSGQNPLTSTTYNTASLPTQLNLGSLDSDAFTYDPNTDRMTQYQFKVNAQSMIGNLTWNANSTLQQLVITDPFNSADNQTCNYLHDDLMRLSSSNCGTPANQTFSYDAFGNIDKSGTPYSFLPTYSYLTNHMTQIGSSTPTYDTNGNVTNDFLHQYAWDADANPVTIDNSVGLTYDALDRMVEQNRSGAHTQIVYTPAGAKLALMSAQVLQKAFISLPGGGVAVYTGGGLDHYRHADWMGSTRLTSSTTRTVLSTTAYAPFGETYAQSGTADLSFTGMNQDTVSGDYDFLYREYGGTEGRWPSPDPAGTAAVNPMNPQSWNRYAYVLNNPLGNIDPLGLDCLYDNENGTATVVRGDCLSETDNGYYVDGTINVNSTFTINADGSLDFGYTDANGNDGVFSIGSFADVDLSSTQGTPPIGSPEYLAQLGNLVSLECNAGKKYILMPAAAIESVGLAPIVFGEVVVPTLEAGYETATSPQGVQYEQGLAAGLAPGPNVPYPRTPFGTAGFMTGRTIRALGWVK